MLGTATKWPPKPAHLDPGEGTLADRRRLLQSMREYWSNTNAARRVKVAAEVEAARKRQDEANAFWDHHKSIVTNRWKNRPGGRGTTKVSDIPEVAAQYAADNLAPAQQVVASEQRGEYRWICPRGLGHASWTATPKDRIQSGTGCPECRNLAMLADIPTLAEQYAGEELASKVKYAEHKSVPWKCQTWVVNPETGEWRPAIHRFEAVIKNRTLQGDGCLICAGYQIDETNSLLTWFPELAREIADPQLNPAILPTSAHNAARKDGHDGSYATITWQCRHGHTWPATINNRVHGNSGCPECSIAGISKEQVRLTAELSGLLELAPSDQSDARLAAGIPDFGSHKIRIPAELKPPGWRYGQLEVDAIFRSGQLRIALEYDGSYHHSRARRDRVTHEIAKDRLLEKLGYVPVRLRVGDLPDLESPAIICRARQGASSFEVARAVLEGLDSKYPGAILGAKDYIAAGTARRQHLADEYIKTVWGELRPVRPRHTTRATEPKKRQLKETGPHPDSLLTPIGPPYRNDKAGGPTLRDYICQCGKTIKRVSQAEVTRGNTRSCGCLAAKAKGKQRISIDRAETAAARVWAASCGIKVKQNGRLSAQIIASYRLRFIDIPDLIDQGRLIKEEAIRAWAANNANIHLLARDKISEEGWLLFAEDQLHKP